MLEEMIFVMESQDLSRKELLNATINYLESTSPEKIKYFYICTMNQQMYIESSKKHKQIKKS